MCMLSMNFFIVCWLFLCLIIPLHGETQRSYLVQQRLFQRNSHRNSIYRVSENTHSVHTKRDVIDSLPAYSNLRKRSGTYYNYPAFQYIENGKSFKEEGNVPSSQMEQRYEEARRKDVEIMKKMDVLDKILSEDNDVNIESKNTIEERITTETNIPEETKRAVRQVRRERPGFFWTLARLTFETINDTRSAIQQISNIINQNFESDTTTQTLINKDSLMIAAARTTTPSTDQNNMSSNLESVNVTTPAKPITTTTPAPFKFTRTGLQSLIRRNLRGLVRLFNIEWQDAWNQSEISVREFQKDLGNQVGGFLQDNPKAF